MVERLLVSGTGLLLVYLAWAWGGVGSIWLTLAVVLATPLLVASLSRLTLRRLASPAEGTPWHRDPFFYTGLLFLAYLGTAWWNAGRILYYDVGWHEWRHSLPRHPGWPSACSRKEAAEMLMWFFPAWCVGLAVRSPLVGRKALRRLLRGVVVSAGLLALVGTLQFITRTGSRYWILPTETFFASFGYTNHAAEYFVLVGLLGLGLLFRDLLHHTGASSPAWRTPVLAGSILLCLIGANLSLSRAGIILAWLVAGFAACYGLKQGVRRISKARLIKLAASMVATVALLYFMVAGVGLTAIRGEFTGKPSNPWPGIEQLPFSIADRPLLSKVAFNVWQDNPLFGVGGWGFRHWMALYIQPHDWDKHILAGNANVHCDPLQFLAEFGLFGFTLLTLATLSLLIPIMRNADWRHPIWVMSTMGLAAIVLWSLVDLPFRCPAILCTWVMVAAASPRLVVRPPTRYPLKPNGVT